MVVHKTVHYARKLYIEVHLYEPGACSTCASVRTYSVRAAVSAHVVYSVRALIRALTVNTV